MNNDQLINQARNLYVLLLIQHSLSIGNQSKYERLNYLTICAYCRYQRRLNRCVLCYRHLTICYRDGKKVCSFTTPTQTPNSV